MIEHTVRYIFEGYFMKHLQEKKIYTYYTVDQTWKKYKMSYGCFSESLKKSPRLDEGEVIQIPSGIETEFFNNFRVRMTGRTTAYTWHLMLSWFEVFGKVMTYSGMNHGIRIWNQWHLVGWILIAMTAEWFVPAFPVDAGCSSFTSLSSQDISRIPFDGSRGFTWLHWRVAMHVGRLSEAVILICHWWANIGHKGYTGN